MQSRPTSTTPACPWRSRWRAHSIVTSRRYSNSMKGSRRRAVWRLPGPGYDFSSARAGVAHLVERDLAKVEVAGSKPVSRSIRTPRFAFETGALRRTQMHQDAELLGSNFRPDAH